MNRGWGLVFFYSFGFWLCQSATASAISEENFSADYSQTVKPYFETAGEAETFKGARGIKIAYRKFIVPNERGAIVISNGRSESQIKYAELIYDLKDLGFSIYIIDHRGQGFSDRMLRARDINHVEHFTDYINDFAFFMKNVVNQIHHDKVFLLAHSMGCAVASLYATANPTAFDALILVSPMFQLNTGKFSESQALALSSFMAFFGFGGRLATGQKRFQDESRSLETSSVTRSPVRYKKTYELYDIYPETQIGGVSYQWVRESIRATRLVKKWPAPTAPILLLQAGLDPLVKLPAQDLYCAKSKNCRKLNFPSAYHEILMERDEIRNSALTEIKNFLNEHAAN